MDQKLQSSTNGKVIALAVAGAFGGFLFGFDASVINGAVNAIQDEYSLNASLTGLAVASALLGAAAGAYLGGSVGDRFGRIPVMLLGSIMFFISSVGSAFAFGVYDLVLWRIVGGLGIGLASVVAPAYIAEISPRQMRGRLGSLQQLAITIGIFSALLSDAVFANTAGGASEPSLFGLDAWRWMFLACAFPAAIYFVIARLLPESPRFLVLKEREDEARTVFAKLWPNGDVDREIRDIKTSIAVDKRAARSGSLRGTAMGLRPIVWVGIALSVFQQFVGINVIFFYSTTLWKAVGFEESSSLTISVFTGLTNILVTFVAIALIDRIGRRPILMTGSIGMTVSLTTMAVAFSQAVTVSGELILPGAWGPIALVAANVFVIFFGASWGPVVWVLLGEIFPNTIRVRALGVAAAAQWVANFLVAVTFPLMAAMSLPLTYGMYALFAGLSFVFVLTKIPETNGMSLDEANTLLPPKNSAKKAVASQKRETVGIDH
ncbi:MULTISPECIES: sugar porter family MFS transporter [Cryobacterium]|uniref:MFS transporter n=1 Tax=Cryobacterium breve TaxID=1259258 RepID=A0ABY2J377_9MICO|nr:MULTISPECIES: sugar porter family MFS transporter [Cryobacterium]TFC91786.1 MFS transporter [Cryobacterium sp. TmT3-12]TFC98336.1 MFS transporter [Cryobacterium breve]